MTVFVRCLVAKYFLQNALIHPVYLEKRLFEQSLPCQNAINRISRINMNNYLTLWTSFAALVTFWLSVKQVSISLQIRDSFVDVGTE